MYQGEVLVSGCEAGLVMVTNVMTGVVLRRVSDHNEAPITGIDIRAELVQVYTGELSCSHSSMNTLCCKCVCVCVCAFVRVCV